MSLRPLESDRPTRMLARLGATAWLALLLSAPAGAGVLAAEQILSGERWAIVIAIGDYPRSKVSGVQHAEEDGRKLADVLRQRYGYDANRMIELYGPQATGKEILRLSSDLRERVDRAASLLDDVGNVYQLAHLLTSASYAALCLGSERDATEFAALARLDQASAIEKAGIGQLRQRRAALREIGEIL